MEKKTNVGKENSYTSQVKLTALNLLGETPNFIALLISAITTKAVLVFVDLVDTAGNVLRNILVALISLRLRKNLKFQYNYGVGKIEALSSLFCDFFMVISLITMLCFAVKDIFIPRPVEAANAMIFVVLVKLLNVAGDIFIYWRQKKICKTNDSLVMRSAVSVAFKNLVFDLSTFTVLILIALFGDRKIFWYLSPVTSLVLGAYLLFVTAKRLIETVGIIIDRSAGEEVQLAILQTLTSVYDKYDSVDNVQSHITGGRVIVDLSLGFPPDTTYKEMQDITNRFSAELTKKIPNCEVSLRIKVTNDIISN